jgi:uncharacterized protein with FMN-binding domain
MAKAKATKATKGRSGGKVTNQLVALSSAAVLTVYSAGYMRTRAAADKIQAADRSRPVIPAAPGDSNSRPIAPLPSAAAVAAITPAPASTAPVPKTPRKVEPVAGPAVHSNPVATPSATPAATSIETPAPVATSIAPPAAVVEPAKPAAPATPQWKDGTYSGWGTSRHGDIEATVVIFGGRISSAVISQCWTRYSCSWVAHLQGQVVTRQSPEVDYVSGATQSTNAFYYAVVQALAKAK